jgi:hypothetical protein
MGPLQLADFIGLDTVVAIAEVLQREFGDDKYRPANILRQHVAAGWLGVVGVEVVGPFAVRVRMRVRPEVVEAVPARGIRRIRRRDHDVGKLSGRSVNRQDGSPQAVFGPKNAARSGY